MTRRKKEIEQYCIEQGFPQGSCSSILEVKAIVATEAIKWADKTMIEKVEQWLIKNNRGQTIGSLHRFLEEE